jgi:hypothetical protein
MVQVLPYCLVTILITHTSTIACENVGVSSHSHNYNGFEDRNVSNTRMGPSNEGAKPVIIIIIQFFIYLRANLTSRRPITK